MKMKTKIGAALLALASLPVAVFLFHVSPVNAVLALLAIGPALMGVATVTYGSFEDGSGRSGSGYNGGITAPTANQAADCNCIRAAISMGDTDTTATITHNWGLNATQLAALYPDISWYVSNFITANVPVNPVLTFALGANTVTVTKLSATSSGGTVNVRVLRPWSGSN